MAKAKLTDDELNEAINERADRLRAELTKLEKKLDAFKVPHGPKPEKLQKLMDEVHAARRACREAEVAAGRRSLRATIVTGKD